MTFATFIFDFYVQRITMTTPSVTNKKRNDQIWVTTLSQCVTIACHGGKRMSITLLMRSTAVSMFLLAVLCLTIPIWVLAMMALFRLLLFYKLLARFRVVLVGSDSSLAAPHVATLVT